jgi:UDP-N-acetylmuramoyl-L-alanyl-D-glutamate--2,6-diaminopimelate ligase
MTTPDAPTLHRAFRAMLDMGVRTVAMEVTSHALAQRRIEGLQYALGVVTNLVPDEHLEFHRTPEEYLRTKVRFFDYLAPGAPLVINADDLLVREKVAEATRRVPRPVIGVSLGALGAELHERNGAREHTDGDVGAVARDPTEDAAVRVEAVSWDGGGSAFALDVRRPIARLTPAASPVTAADGDMAPGAATIEPCVIPIAVPVLGLQHVANAAIAATAALVAGASPSGVTEGLAELEPITRRMEIVRVARPRIVDDTAGNPVTLRAVFATTDGLALRGLRVVFGIRGSRGPEINRRLATTLGRLVCARIGRYPVTLIVTASEDAADRRNRVQPEERDAAMEALDAAGAPYAFEPLLATAVARALEATHDDDLLLLLGAQGMDRAAELTRRALEVRPGTR